MSLRQWVHRWAKLLATVTEPSARPENQLSHKIDPLMCGLSDIVRDGWYDNQTGSLAPGFELDADDLVLDIGCGGGGGSQFCARNGAAVIYADISMEKLPGLREKLEAFNNIFSHPMVCDALKLPFKDCSFSKIISMEILEHTQDPAGVLSELARVGRQDARYLISVPHSTIETMQKGIAPDAFFRSPNHVHIFQEGAILDLVRGAGLAVERVETIGFYWSVMMLLHWSTRRLSNTPLEGAALDSITPPFHPLMLKWADFWNGLLEIPEGLPIKHRLDKLLPRTLVIIARKSNATNKQEPDDACSRFN